MKITKLQLRELIREMVYQYRDAIDKYVKGNVYYPPQNLGYDRINMPQIEDDQQINFFKYLDRHGVKFRKKNVKVDTIKPAQKDLRVDVASQLLMSNSPKLKKPLLVSSDMYLMDGHHRWLALMFGNPSQKLNVIIIGMTGKQLLDVMRKFDAVQFKGID
jgi:hypothetical protein